LTSYFEEHQNIFRKVAKRQELWRKMLELEEKKKDPSEANCYEAIYQFFIPF